jgi:hypothetical protein
MADLSGTPPSAGDGRGLVAFPEGPSFSGGAEIGGDGRGGSRLRTQSLSAGRALDITPTAFSATSKTEPKSEGRARASSQPICVPSALQAPTDKYAGSGSGSPAFVEEYYESKSWLMYTSMKEKGMNPESPLESSDERTEEEGVLDMSADDNLLFDME